MIKKVLLITLMIVLLPTLASAKRLFTEAKYQKMWCDYNKGTTEVILIDGTRADCLTNKNVIEVDYADKWYEAIGQALHYGTQLFSRRPGIVLIIEHRNDYRYFERMMNVIKEYKLPIDVWLIDNEGMMENY